MDHSIAPGIFPAPRGLEKEEPEIGYEADIPSDDDNRETTSEDPPRAVERE